ncbi:MAG: tetratricopeptide repeat protein [Bacteroidia bacterium]|nr:tetratricopeptide repeat protein [Bacteroidia bacterium]
MIRLTKSFIVFLSGLFLCCCATATRAQDINAAIKLTVSEQFELADAAFQNLIKAQPQNGDNYFYYGENYLHIYFTDTVSKELKDACQLSLVQYKKGTDNDPKNPLNWVGIGMVNMFMGDTVTARVNFDKAISLLPTRKNRIIMSKDKQSTTYVKIAEAYILAPRKNIPKALSLLDQAEKISPKLPVIFLTRGDAYLEINDGSNAILNYKRAQEFDMKSPLAKIKIGNIYVRGKNLKAAIPYFEDAVQTDSTFAPVYRELGELYFKAGQYDNAKKNYKKFLLLSDKNISAKIRYAQFLLLAKDYQEVINQVNQILKVDSDNIYLNRFLAYSYFETGQYDKSNASMKKFLKKIQPDKIIRSDYEYYGHTLSKLNQDSLAVLNLNKAYDLDTSDNDLLSDIAVIFIKMKKYNDVVKTYNRKIANRSITITDYYSLGKTYYSNQQFGKADTALAYVIMKKPDFMPAYLWRARANSNLDPELSTGQAKPCFELLVEKAKTDSVKYKNELIEAYGYLGYYYLKNKDNCNAKKLYKKVLEMDPANENAQKVLGSKEMKKVDC